MGRNYYLAKPPKLGVIWARDHIAKDLDEEAFGLGLIHGYFFTAPKTSLCPSQKVGKYQREEVERVPVPARVHTFQVL